MNDVFSPGADKIAENATNYSDKHIGHHVLSNVGEGLKAIRTQITKAKTIADMNKSINNLSVCKDIDKNDK